MSNNKTKNFVIQGSILAIAGVLVRVIGLIYRIPLTRIIGDEGNGYYGTAFEIYNILILLSSQSMPLAVSKIVSERRGKKQFKNAYNAFKVAFVYALVLGVAVGLIAFFGADWISTKIYGYPPVAYALRVLAPTLTVACVLGVIRGFFQGMGDMVPTAISQIFEQIVNAVVSIIAAIELVAYASTLPVVINSVDPKVQVATNKAAYGAMGGTCGTLAGAVTALLVVAIIFFRRAKAINDERISDNSGVRETKSKMLKVILLTITPVLISTTIYNINSSLDNPIFGNIMMRFFGMSSRETVTLWGIYAGKYRVLTTVAIAIAAALSTAMVPSLARSNASQDKEGVKNKINQAFKFSMIVAIPCGVGLSVLGGPINNLLFTDNSAHIGKIMLFSLFTVFAFSLSTISNAILQGIDHLSIPIRNSAISLGIHLVFLPLLLILFKLNIYAVIIGDFSFAAVICVLNAYSIKKYVDYKHDIVGIFVKPLISAVFMGVFAFLVYRLFNDVVFIRLIKSLRVVNGVSVVLAIALAAIVYMISLIITKSITEDELMNMPKGTLIVKILKKVKLMR